MRIKPYYYFLLILAVFCSTGIRAATNAGQLTIRKQVAALLSRMTLEEKIGQMTQLTIQAVSYRHGPERGKLNIDSLDKAIVKYHVGSLFNVFDSSISLSSWNKLITEIQNVATRQTRLKIPILYGIDAIHGATYTKGATLFPQPLGMAATFDTALARKEGEITALEVRASGIPWIFYPVDGLGRQPLWSRLYETFGEDPYLASCMTRSYIEGAQGNNIGSPDRVATCLKHYVGYSVPIDGKDRTPAWIPRRMMKQYFLPPFQAGVEAGAPTVMTNSSEVNGIPGDANYDLLTRVLRGRMDFHGFIVSDWGDIESLYTRYRVASSPAEAVKMAVMAGVDMSMVPDDYSFYNLLIKLVKDGQVPMWRIDQAVARILTLKFELGLFKDPYPDRALAKRFASPSSGKTNLEAAEESITLVKNDNHFLPLSKNSRILVAGPTADELSSMNGGWTITWQGNVERLYPANRLTPLQAIEGKVGKNNVVYLQGCTYDSLIDARAAVKAAKYVDAVILCLGEHTYAETAGNINNLVLPDAQMKLAKALIATGKPVVLVMFEGRPRVIDSIVGGARSVLIAFLPGMEGGEALANILFGDVNPSGRLPVTYPRYANALYHYDHDEAEVMGGNVFDPQWNFGYGLSYASFKYTDLKIGRKEIAPGEKETVSVDVTNTGKMAGEDVVELYLGERYRQVTHPIRQLEGFNRIYLKAGEREEVSFVIAPQQMSFVGVNNRRVIQPGIFTVTVGGSSREFTVAGNSDIVYKVGGTRSTGATPKQSDGGISR